MSKLKKVENEIIELHEYDLPYGLASFTGTTEWKTKQLNILETKRHFLLDRRESWFPKTLWNLLIPIIVSILTIILTLYSKKYFGDY